MNLLITGIAGFIGSNYVKYILKNKNSDKIIGLDKLTYAGNLENLTEYMNNPRFMFYKGDISNKKIIKKLFDKYDFDGVINFAAESHVDRSIFEPQIFLKTNILGTQILLNHAKKYWYNEKKDVWRNNVKFIQISTDEVYGSLDKTGYFTEKTPLDPHSPYSASKASADLICKSYYDTYKMPINITRCSNNYGPYQFPEKLIPLIINNALNHQKLPIYGDGKQIRDWLYVVDHCKAVDLVFRKAGPGEIYNIGGHNEKENIFIVKKIIATLKKKTGDNHISEDLIEHVKDRKGHDRRYAINPDKIRKELGWKPETLFKEGIEKTIDWYLKNRKWMKRVITGEYQNFYEKNYSKR